MHSSVVISLKKLSSDRLPQYGSRSVDIVYISGQLFHELYLSSMCVILYLSPRIFVNVTVYVKHKFRFPNTFVYLKLKVQIFRGTCTTFQVRSAVS